MRPINSVLDRLTHDHKQPMTTTPTLKHRRLKAGFYPSGFRVGDRITTVRGPRTYNVLITIPSGTTGIVDEPTNFDDWPDDAVQVDMTDVGCGALDACILVKDNDRGRLLPPPDSTLMLVKFKVYDQFYDVYIDPSSVESICRHWYDGTNSYATKIFLASGNSWWVCGSVDEVAHLIDLAKNRTVNETSPK